MRAKLRACVECGRHIRIVEGGCPFCGAALPASFAEPPARGRPMGVLGRAAVVMVGAAAAASATSLAGCSAGVSGGGDGRDLPPISAADAYGLPAEAGFYDHVSSADAYGLPPDRDAEAGISFGDAYGLPADGGRD